MNNKDKFSAQSVAGREEGVLDFWREKNIFQKSIDKDAPQGEYVFYDGPPFATGLPHYGHILISAIKDAVPRYQTMLGKRVWRRWGWDCHGLPIENIVEKELKISGKKQIEKIGVADFNAKARESVLKFVSEWKKTIDRIGRWVEFDGSYKTMDNNYIESVWWAIKEIHKKELLYEGTKVLPYCPRCETPIANAEIAMDNSYKEISDISVYAKFKLLAEKNTYLLAWTTTPWTLPGNTALAINPKAVYVSIAKDGKNYILAKNLLATLELGDYKIKKTFKGRSLVGCGYQPLFVYYAKQSLPHQENGWKVYAGDFVTMEEGTGIVHIAPAFGEDDMALAQKHELPVIKHVTSEGLFKDEFGGDQTLSFKGVPVKAKDNHEQSDVKIIQYLAKNELLFLKKKIKHSYPHCFRCETPLYYFALPAWFINIKKIKAKLLRLNKKINWIPEHLKDGRFRKSVEAAPDWNISRNRYWASPLPIWRCDSCSEIVVIGSRAELIELAPAAKELTDFHRPYIDEIFFNCVKCDGKMHRISEVVDCWLESGSMPFARDHYPFDNQKEFKKTFPANFISEYIAQTRTWFYYTHVLAAILFNKVAFLNVLTTGTILAEDGQKMSKSKGNFPDPQKIFDKYGVDALRFYLLSSPVLKSEDFSFSETGVAEALRKIVLTTENVIAFYELYKGANIPSGKLDINIVSVLDRWLVMRFDETLALVSRAFDEYDLPKATRAQEDFIRDLSQWYLRRSRERFKGDDQPDKESAIKVLGEVLLGLAKILAPITPFLAERIYYRLAADQVFGESVHLGTWPQPLQADSASEILAEMQLAREAVEIALSIRATKGLKVRQPLSEMQVFVDQKLWEPAEEIKNIILSEMNIRKWGTFDSLDDFDDYGDKIVVLTKGAISVMINIELSPELLAEGCAREVIRFINSLRKDRGLTIVDKVVIEYFSSDDGLLRVMEEFSDFIAERVIASKLQKKSSEHQDSIVINKAVLQLTMQKDK